MAPGVAGNDGFFAGGGSDFAELFQQYLAEVK
jgi:hypothetical protein